VVRALHFYRGVPQLIVPDNPRAVISSPDRYEPRAHDTVQDFARYYGTSVLLARPRTPRDKASVESSVPRRLRRVTWATAGGTRCDSAPALSRPEDLNRQRGQP
jgi:transposase